MKLFKNMRIRHAQMMVRTDLRIPVVCEKWVRRSDSLQELTKLPSKQLSLYSRAQRVFRLRPVVLQNERVAPAGLSCMRIAFRMSGRQVVYAHRFPRVRPAGCVCFSCILYGKCAESAKRPGFAPKSRLPGVRKQKKNLVNLFQRPSRVRFWEKQDFRTQSSGQIACVPDMLDKK